MINDIEKPEIKKEIEEIKKIFPKNYFEKYLKLKNSLFFMQLFRVKHSNGKHNNEKEIMEKAEDDFKKLKLLFEKENWYDKIPETIIKECYKCIKNKEGNLFKNELNNLQQIFNIKNLNNNDLEKLEKDIIVFNKKPEIILTVNSCMNLIDEVDAKKTDFYKELDTINQNLKMNISPNEIEKYGKYFDKFGIDVIHPKEEDKKYLNILNIFSSKKGLINYIVKLDDTNIEELLFELNTKISNNEIKDMIICKNFFQNLMKINTKNDKELIQSFFDEIQKIKNIGIYIEYYINDVFKIQKKFSPKLDKLLSLQQELRNIMKYAKFYLNSDYNSEPIVKYDEKKIKEEKTDFRMYHYTDIIELREQIVFTKMSYEQNFKAYKDIFIFFKLFSERIDEIEIINELLAKIGQKSYNETIEIVITISENNSLFTINYNNIENYQSCYRYLNNLYNKITEIQINYYKKEEMIRYIYGRQFNLLNSCLKNKGIELSNFPFFKFLINDKIDLFSNLDYCKNINYNYDYDLDENKYICLLKNIKIFLEYFLEINALQLEEIYKQNIIKEKYRLKFKGLFIYKLKKYKFYEVQKSIEVQLLNLYSFLTGYPPMAQTILLCNEETSCEQITSFMYRAFLCQYPVFFL